MKELVAVVVDSKGVETQKIFAASAGGLGVAVNLTEPSVAGAVQDATPEAGKTLRVETDEYLAFKKAEAERITETELTALTSTGVPLP